MSDVSEPLDPSCATAGNPLARSAFLAPSGCLLRRLHDPVSLALLAGYELAAAKAQNSIRIAV